MIRVAILGTGPTASAHIKSINLQDNLDVVCIVSRNVDNLKKLGIRDDSLSLMYASDLENCWNRFSPDVIVLVPPIELVERFILQAIKYPWIVLTEKPLGINYEAALRISEACNRKAFTNLYVAMNRRFYKSVVSFGSFLESHPDNYLFEFRASYYTTSNNQSHYHPLVLENMDYAQSIHLIDLIRVFTKAHSIKPRMLSRFRSGQVGIDQIQIKSENWELLYTSTMNAFDNWSVKATSSMHTLLLKPLEKLEIFLNNSDSREPFRTVNAEEDFNQKPGFPGLYSALKKKVFEESDDLVNFADALQSMELVKALRDA